MNTQTLLANLRASICALRTGIFPTKPQIEKALADQFALNQALVNQLNQLQEEINKLKGAISGGEKN